MSAAPTLKARTSSSSAWNASGSTRSASGSDPTRLIWLHEGAPHRADASYALLWRAGCRRVGLDCGKQVRLGCRGAGGRRCLLSGVLAVVRLVSGPDTG